LDEFLEEICTNGLPKEFQRNRDNLLRTLEGIRKPTLQLSSESRSFTYSLVLSSES
jgi:hypothetical protein